MRFKDLTGKTYNNLYVVKYYGRDLHGRMLWECKCACGNTTIVRGSALTTGNTKSCGCLRINTIRKVNFSHGESNTRLYHIWIGIKSRCYDKNCNTYSYYGGREISMCDEWRNSFEAFYDWAMNNGYTSILSIDRIDVNGNYCEQNCRWITQREQTRNTRSNRFITCFGKTNTLGEWSEISGIKRETIAKRLNIGWNSEKAIYTIPHAN